MAEFVSYAYAEVANALHMENSQVTLTVSLYIEPQGCGLSPKSFLLHFQLTKCYL